MIESAVHRPTFIQTGKLGVSKDMDIGNRFSNQKRVHSSLTISLPAIGGKKIASIPRKTSEEHMMSGV